MTSTTPQCATCGDLMEASFLFVFLPELLELTVSDRKLGKKDKDLVLYSFLKAVNALLNEGGGVVCIHEANLALLNLFDEQVDGKMMNLISDDSFFHENFERLVGNDNHIIFRVQQRRRPISTLHFNTKMAANKGLLEATHANMRYLMRKISTRPGQQELDCQRTRDTHVAFVKEQCVDMRENVCTQLKSLCNFRPQHNENKIKELARFMWEELRLKEFITAFITLPNGGSVFFGLNEEKKIKLHKEVITGNIICDGITLDKDERDQLTIAIRENICNQDLMCWLSTSEVRNPVQIQYHPVTGGAADLFVLEVKVNKVHGAVFYRNDSCYVTSGPMAFKLCMDDTTERENTAVGNTPQVTQNMKRLLELESTVSAKSPASGRRTSECTPLCLDDWVKGQLGYICHFTVDPCSTTKGAEHTLAKTQPRFDTD